jgi:hypothetical protein
MIMFVFNLFLVVYAQLLIEFFLLLMYSKIFPLSYDAETELFILYMQKKVPH